MTDREQQQLDNAGFVVLPEFMGPQLLADLRRRVADLFAEEGSLA